MASLDSKPVERYTVVTRGVSNNAISTGRVFRNGATATTASTGLNLTGSDGSWDPNAASTEQLIARLKVVEEWVVTRDKERERAVTDLTEAAEMRAAQDADRMGSMQERISQLCDHISELETRASMATTKATNDYTAEREGWTEEKRRLQLELEHAEELKEQLTQRHDTMKAVVKARSETLQVMQEELSRVSIDYAEQLKQKEILEEGLTSLTANDDKLNELVATMVERNKELEENLFKGEVETAELRKAPEGEVERLSVEFTSAQHDHAMEVAALRDQLATGEALIADQQGGLAAQLREMGETRDEAAQATADASKAKAQVKVLQELVANLEEAMAVSESTVEELVKHGTELEESAEAKAAALAATLATREKELAVLETSERAAKADRDAAKEELKVAKRHVEETTVSMAEELESVLEAHAALESQRAHSNKMVATLQKEAQAAALTAASAQCDVVQARNAVLASAAAMEKHMQALKDITEGATTKKKKGFGKKNGESVEFKDPAGMLRQTVSTASALALEMEALVKQVEQKTSHIEDPSEGQALLADVEKALAAVDKAKPKEKEAENLDSQIRGLQGKLGVLNNLMG